MLTSNQFTKGINQDIHPKYQEEGTYRFALNAVLETEFGENPSVSNERGNIICAELPEGKILVGHSLLDNDEIFVALYDPNGDHEIGFVNSSLCEYSTLAIDSCFNFSDKHPVDILFRIRNGCERIVYLRDTLNEYRVINLTDTSYWLDGTDVIDCNRIKLYKDYNMPCISLFIGEGDLGITDSGGQLLIGTYQFAIRYLDSELNPTNWIFITRPVPIADEPFEYTNDAGTLNLYDGASNVSTSPFYKPPTNKAIKLQLGQLDNDTFSFYQFAVIKRTGDAGEISGVDLLTPIPIDSTTSTFTYTGYNSQIVGESTIDDILSNYQAIDVVIAHAQLDNRLYIAGLTNTTYDWSTFQRKASKIKTEWVKAPLTSPVTAFPKQGTYYFENASFMEDEIYALGIVYIMEDGSLSPVFHIPGRPADDAAILTNHDNPLIGNSGVTFDLDAWDRGTTTTYGTGIPSSKTERWQHISTAGAYSPTATVFNRGIMGYHEAVSETYPEITTCDGESYWGQDFRGNDIEAGVTKIRHHRMPPAHLVTTGYLDAPNHRLGIRFTNVEYPEGAIRHFFVYADRSFEKSILAKGVIIPLLTPDEFEFFGTYTEDEPPLGVDGGYFDNIESEIVFAPHLLRPVPVEQVTSPVANLKTFAFFCSEGVLLDKAFQPRYITIEKMLFDNEFGFGLGANRDEGTVTVGQYDDSFTAQTDLWHLDKSENANSIQPTDGPVNYSVAFSGKVPKATYGSRTGAYLYNPSDRSILNLSYNLSPIILTLNEQLEQYDSNSFVNPNNGFSYTGSYEDGFLFVSLKVDIDPFTNLHNLTYKRMGNCPLNATSTATTFASYSGDTFSTHVNITDYAFSQSEEDGKRVRAFHLAFPTQDTFINYEFRHGSLDPLYSYFQWNYEHDPEGHVQFRKHLQSKYYELTDGLIEMYPQSFEYNDSFSYIQSLEDYLPLAFNYEYCNDCIENYPYRIYYSELDSSEDQSDKYRLFRPNNYKDLEGVTGPITDLFINFDKLYARTTNSIFYLPTRPQQLQSDETSIYIGTGEVLSLPAQQLKTSENAFGGGNFFKARTTTEYGTVYVDDISGRVFLLTNQLNDLSNIGLRNFFQNHGRVSFLHQFFDSTGVEFPFLSTSSDSGVGYISWYDPRYKRVFIHKRDYKLLDSYTLTYSATDTDEAPLTLDPFEVRFNGFSFYSDNILGDVTQITFEDGKYFENKSFTLSYSFLTNHWVSFHSFLPSYGLGSHTGHLTFSTQLYKHDYGDFTTYYEKKSPHIIDLIAINNPLETKLTSSVFYSGFSSIYDADSKEYKKIPDTYTGYIAYNSNQSSGYQILNLKTNPFSQDSSNVEAFVRETDKQYRINDLRDRTFDNNNPIWTSNWNLISGEYFIDKVPYLSNIDINQSGFNAKRFRDYYLGLRLFFNPTTNAKITTDLISTINTNQNR